MAEYWRDLKVGEEIKVGDRCFGGDDKWFTISDLNLEYQRHVTGFSRPLQRKADCVPPIENGKNRYGVDVSYFRNAINRELNRGLTDYKADELARVLARLSVTADSQVIFENEFQAREL